MNRDRHSCLVVRTEAWRVVDVVLVPACVRVKSSCAATVAKERPHGLYPPPSVFLEGLLGWERGFAPVER